MTEKKIFGDNKTYSVDGPFLESWKHEGIEYRLIQRHGLYFIWDSISVRGGSPQREPVDVGRDKAFAEQCWRIRKEVIQGTYKALDPKERLPVPPPNHS